MKSILAVPALALALGFALFAPPRAAQAQTVTVSVDTPDFGIRIGSPPVVIAPAPVYAPPVYAPVPVYAPPPVYVPVYRPVPVYTPPPRVIVPTPVYRPGPYFVPRHHRDHDWHDRRDGRRDWHDRHDGRHDRREIRDVKYHVKYR